MQHIKTSNYKEYSIVSLGFFCSVALEHERIGIRDCSLPFDWLITSDFRKVLELIENNFEGFLLEENLYQEASINPNYYYDSNTGFHFYHDFVYSKPLKTQYDIVKKKFDKRIKRFYNLISQPTLFVRYCNTVEELAYIVKHKDYILELLRKYNEKNEIIYITSQKYDNTIEGIYFVEADKNDSVARNYLKKIPHLEQILLDRCIITREQIKHNQDKAKLKYRFPKQILKKLKKIIGHIMTKAGLYYHHSKQYTNL